jgi:transposase-like protein
LDDGGSLSGRVEIDETYMGGRRKGSPAGGRPGPNDSTKPPVLAMAERQGKIKARVVPNVRRASLQPEIRRFVLPSSIIYTDELKSYDLVGREYRRHYRIPHSQGIYIDGHVHVNTVESFFGLVKNGIKGSYRGVSTRYLQYYLDEYAWRWNHKYDRRSMFQTILDQVEKGRLPLPAAP